MPRRVDAPRFHVLTFSLRGNGPVSPPFGGAKNCVICTHQYSDPFWICPSRQVMRPAERRGWIEPSQRGEGEGNEMKTMSRYWMQDGTYPWESAERELGPDDGVEKHREAQLGSVGSLERG